MIRNDVNKGGFKMSENEKTTDNRNMHATILGVLGIIFVIIGAGIVFIPHAPMRGSGLGTALIVLGVALLFIAVIRFMYKRT
jgi:multisubunit Na+/H+ antiporter MnhG subunit